MQLRPFFALLLPLVLACGSVETSQGTPQKKETTDPLTAACHHLFARRHAFDLRCSGVFARHLDEDAYVASCLGVVAAPGVTLTTADVRACADEIDASGCLGGGVFPSCVGYGGDMLYPQPPSDKRGTLTPGEACFASVQCDSGMCDTLANDCGACLRPRALGEGCSGESDTCVEGSCQQGTCQLLGKKLGEDCIDYGGGDCQPSLYCKGQDPETVMGKCLARPGEGGACDGNIPCLEGLACHAGACVKLAADGAACVEDSLCASGHCANGDCAPWPSGLTEGQDCSLGYCRADLLCDDDHVCRAVAWVTAGGVCSIGGAPDGHCAQGLYCHRTCFEGPCGADGECRVLPGPGETCGDLGACAADAACEGYDYSMSPAPQGTCIALGRVGEACPCLDTLACVAGACAAFGASVCE